MRLMIATANFMQPDVGAKRSRDKFWAEDALADELERIGVAQPEGKYQAQAYATKVEPWSVQPAAQAFAERMSNTAEVEAGPSGPQTTATDSDVTPSTPVTADGGQPIRKRRGRPPKAGHKTESPPSASV